MTSALPVLEVLQFDAFERGGLSEVGNRTTRDVVSTLDDARAANFDECHCFGLAWFEANGCAGGNIEPLSVSRAAIKTELRVRLDKMIMTADLHWAVSQVGNRN